MASRLGNIADHMENTTSDDPNRVFGLDVIAEEGQSETDSRPKVAPAKTKVNFPRTDPAQRNVKRASTYEDIAFNIKDHQLDESSEEPIFESDYNTDDPE